MSVITIVGVLVPVVEYIWSIRGKVLEYNSRLEVLIII